jgi:hypothetical protein
VAATNAFAVPNESSSAITAATAPAAPPSEPGSNRAMKFLFISLLP